MNKLLYWFCFFGLSVVIGVGCLRQDEVLAKETVEQKIVNESNDSMEISIIGGGCFWCTESIFQRIRGVIEVVPGYMGGHIKNPAYREVCNGNTGHTETIKVLYEQDIISYGELLEIFFLTHDVRNVIHTYSTIYTTGYIQRCISTPAVYIAIMNYFVPE